MDKVFFGVVSYGPQTRAFWLGYSNMLALAGKYDIEYTGQASGVSMRTDGNRNQVVQSFLKSKADWLMWIDSDNIIPLGGVRRLLDTQKTLVTGLYYIKIEPYTPVAYWRTKQGTYKPINEWRRGEIVPVDVAGMGACLCHRSVFEDIKNQCILVQRYDGGITPVHKSRIYGEIPVKLKLKQPSITDGVMKIGVCKPNFQYGPYPFFDFGYGRTEDLIFYELASQCGHNAWCDTSVECDHISNEWIINGEAFRDNRKKNMEVIPLVKEYVNIEMEEYSKEE